MKDRFYAFLTHLAISGIVAIIAVVIVFCVWYPAPLQDAVGVTHIFLMLLSIDIAIGPVLTFVVYKRGKSSLKFDLSVIALCQLAALSYGMHTVFIGRPAFVVFNVDRFDVSRAHELDPESLKKAQLAGNKAAEIGWFGPRWVAAKASSDPKRRQEILFSSALGGADWPHLPELFVPLAELKSQVLAKAISLSELRKLHGNSQDIQTLLSGFKDTDVKWLPLHASAKDMVVLVDASSAKVVKIIGINPWL